MADDFVSGTRWALMGGNITVMPLQKRERLRAALTAYHALEFRWVAFRS